MLARRTGWALALTSLAVHAGASAQDIPYDNVLVGDRAFGLAGAFSGLADDATATFHNPAGIALLPTTSVSGSLWVVAFGRHRIDDGYRTDEGTTDLADKGTPSLPSLLTGVLKLGPKDELNERRHALGLALLNPRRGRVEYSARNVADDDSSLSSLSMTRRDRARWFGASYAYRLRADVALGVTTFLAFRSLLHQELEASVTRSSLTAGSSSVPVVRDTHVKLTLRQLLVRVGGLFDVSPQVRLGFMLQPPGIPLTGSGRHLDVRGVTVPPDSTDFTAEETRGLTARGPIPWEARVGATYFASSEVLTLLTADLSLHGPVKRTRILGPDDRLPPLFMPGTMKLRPSVRGALGFELTLADRIPIRGGFLGAMPETRGVPQMADAPTAPQLFMIGGTVSVGALVRGSEIALGVGVLHERGHASALARSRADGVPRYHRADARSTSVLLFISGGKRAVHEAARRLHTAVESVRERRQEEGDGIPALPEEGPADGGGQDPSPDGP